jgi:hypothetical protein
MRLRILRVCFIFAPRYFQEIQSHAETLVANLRAEYESLAVKLRAAAAARGAGDAAARCELSVRAQTPAAQSSPSAYDGKTWSFDLTSESEAISIGRSKAKKFTTTGISLPKDDGVSTSHAKVFFCCFFLTSSSFRTAFY